MKHLRETSGQECPRFLGPFAAKFLKQVLYKVDDIQMPEFVQHQQTDSLSSHRLVKSQQLLSLLKDPEQPMGGQRCRRG